MSPETAVKHDYGGTLNTWSSHMRVWVISTAKHIIIEDTKNI